MIITDFFYSIWQFFVYLFSFFIPKRYFFKDVSQETVLITGGGSGLGRLLALAFSSLGSHVVIIDVNKEGLEETARLIVKSGGSCRFYQCDISKRDYVYSIAEKIKQDNGFISIVINNAGITGGSKRLLELNDERIIKTIEVNTLAHFWIIKSFLPEMKQRNHGHIVTISSFAGLNGAPSLADYSASKFAAIGLAESLYYELHTDGYNGIKTTIVCPFVIDTGLFKGASLPLIPQLKAKEVAEQIIQAILLDQTILVLPKYLYLTIIIKTLFPTAVGLKVFNLLNGGKLMDKFTGRGEIEMKNGDKQPSISSNNNETVLLNNK